MNAVNNTASSIGHGNISRIPFPTKAGQFVDLDFWRMLGDPAFEGVVFRVQKGLPTGFEGPVAEALKVIYGAKITDTYFLSIWKGKVKREGKGRKTVDVKKASTGTPTDLPGVGAIPVGYGEQDLRILLRCMLSAKVTNDDKQSGSVNF